MCVGKSSFSAHHFTIYVCDGFTVAYYYEPRCLLCIKFGHVKSLGRQLAGHKHVRREREPVSSQRVEPTRRRRSSNTTLRQRGMETTQVASSSGVTLSVRIFRPASNAMKKLVTLVLVHQYSLMRGCQELLCGMAYRLANKGFTTVTFDMRGVGGSTGKPSLTGTPEVQDVVAVSQWASQHCSAPSILLVGSSAGKKTITMNKKKSVISLPSISPIDSNWLCAGAPIAGAAIDAVKEVVGYVSLGYPFGLLASVLFGRHHKLCLQSPKPKLFVMGTTDGFTSVKQLESKLKSAAGRVEKRLVKGAGHFEMEGPQYDDQMVEYITTFADSLQGVEES